MTVEPSFNSNSARSAPKEMSEILIQVRPSAA